MTRCRLLCRVCGQILQAANEARHKAGNQFYREAKLRESNDVIKIFLPPQRRTLISVRAKMTAFNQLALQKIV